MGSSCASWTKRSTVQKYSTFWMFQSSIRSPTRYFWGHVSAICEKLCQIWLTHRNYVQTSQTWLRITGIFTYQVLSKSPKTVQILFGCFFWQGLCVHDGRAFPKPLAGHHYERGLFRRVTLSDSFPKERRACGRQWEGPLVVSFLYSIGREQRLNRPRELCTVFYL